jgi:arylsulfatase A-like enzyme
MVAAVSDGFGGVIGRTYRESTPWWPAAPRPPRGAPSIVFVVLDDVGFADLGCYGGDIATPHVDELAAGGLRYTNFHVTSMCSPTRACLLTGRNAHAVGLGIIAEWSSGFPGYQGRLARRAATLAEILREHAYGTYAVGKWHLGPLSEATAAGPFDAWPLARGFDRWYGFHGALTDQWHPELFEDNHAVELPRRLDYHLSEDLVDRAIALVRDHHTAAPDRPFFLYLAFGACHWPHHVPPAYLDKYRGRYDEGWDAVRQERFVRQKALGIVPPAAQLAPRNPDVAAWDALTADQRRLVVRLQEAYAAFLDHTDAQIGRLLAFLGAIGRREDTLIALLSDNGASPEGGAFGAVNERKHLNYEPETLAESLAALDRIGSVGLQPLPDRLGPGQQHAAQVVQEGHARRGHPRPAHPVLAATASGWRHPHAVPPRDRRRADRAGGGRCRRPHRVPGHRPAPDPRREHGLHLRRSRRADDEAGAALRDARRPRPVVRRLGGGCPPHQGRGLRRRPVGAVPPRRGLLGVPGPGRRPAAEAA